MIPPYPLQWPEGLRRTTRPIKGAFKTSLSQAIENVQSSLRRFAADTGQQVTNVSVTSNVAGLATGTPADRGIAVWFEWDGEQRVIAVDRYDRIEHNVQAIHHIIEARRTELRHGGLNVVRQTFRGFTMLPAPERWQDVLGLPPGSAVTLGDVETAYRKLAAKAHPDKGGSQDAMARLNRARDAAVAELGGGLV